MERGLWPQHRDAARSFDVYLESAESSIPKHQRVMRSGPSGASGASGLPMEDHLQSAELSTSNHQRAEPIAAGQTRQGLVPTAGRSGLAMEDHPQSAELSTHDLPCSLLTGRCARIVRGEGQPGILPEAGWLSPFTPHQVD